MEGGTNWSVGTVWQAPQGRYSSSRAGAGLRTWQLAHPFSPSS